LQYTALQGWGGTPLTLSYEFEKLDLKKLFSIRAPVLVAIALVEHGLDAISAVQFIRERRYSAYELNYQQCYS